MAVAQVQLRETLATWFGVPVQKNPFDLMMLQEAIYETKPDVIIETGTFLGGSALFMAGILELLGKGIVISIDVVKKVSRHPRMVCLGGDSVSPQIQKELQQLVKPSHSVMVDLDSDHSKKHVLEELALYAPLVTPGNYLVVEDTNTSGPAEAVAEFMEGNGQFSIDKNKELHGFTFFPNGWLKRI